METANVAIGTVLISDALNVTPLKNLLDSGVDVVAVDEKGVRVKRRHPSYNGEEFFLTMDALKKSHWIEAPDGASLTWGRPA